MLFTIKELGFSSFTVEDSSCRYTSLFFILIGSVLNMWSTEDVSSTIRNTLFHKTKQENVTMFVKLVCCQDFLLLFLTFNKTIFCLNSRSMFKEVSLLFKAIFWYSLWYFISCSSFYDLGYPFKLFFFPVSTLNDNMLMTLSFQTETKFTLLSTVYWYSSQGIRRSETYCLLLFSFQGAEDTISTISLSVCRGLPGVQINISVLSFSHKLKIFISGMMNTIPRIWYNKLTTHWTFHQHHKIGSSFWFP